MSASRERKARAQQAQAQPVKKETKQKKKLSEGWILAVSVILVVVVVFGAVLGIRHYQQNQTVLTAGGKEVTVKEFNYFYNAVVNNFSSNYSSYTSYMGIDSGSPLDKQPVQAESVSMMSMLGMDTDVLTPYATEGTTYDITWAGYFALLARESAVQAYTLYQKATEAGFGVSEEVQATIDEEIMMAQLYASIYGYSDTDSFLEASYGNGCNEENYREYLKVVNVAYDYAADLTYTEAELTARYEEAPEEFDVVSYLLYTANASDFMSEEEAAAAEESTEEETTISPEALAEAKAAAEAMVAEFNPTAINVTAEVDQVRATAEANTTSEAAQWMFESAKAGDVALFADEEAGLYYVVKLISSVDYDTVNALMIYIANDEEATEEEHDHEHEEGEEAEEATLTAAEKLQAVEAALAADASEESFREIAAEYNESETLEIKQASHSVINSNITVEALLWMTSAQEQGAYATFSTADGTFILYYIGTDDNYRDLSVTSTITSEWLEAITEEAMAVCKYDADAAMNGGVGITLGTQA